MIRGLAAALLAAASLAVAAEPPVIAPFSSASPGGRFPRGWVPRFIAGVPPAELGLVADDGTTVLEVHSSGGSGAAAHALRVDPGEHPIFSWRWKVDRALEGSDVGTRGGDDYAARVYVFFDVPLEELPIFERFKVHMARLIHGADVPAAALCYVWESKSPIGTSAWNAYTGRVRMIVLQSGPSRAGTWVSERRDVAADYRAAFEVSRVPPVSGIALGNDTDQTRGNATARFGDARFGPP